MGVALGGPVLGPPQQVHERPGVDAVGEKQRGGGVTGVVDASVTNTGETQHLLPLRPIAARVDRCPELRGEDPVVLGPQEARLEPLGGLGGLMGAQERRQAGRQRNGS